VFTAALRDLPSVNIAWQLDVGNQDVRDLPSALYERLLTVRGVDYFEAFFAKSFDHELADQGVVLDD
jgi:hypothetical protein